jgi:DNA polymerase IV
MDLPLNKNKPVVMHIDLNSCFATIEQQANPLLRGKPVVVAAYATPNGCVLAPSIEAKRLGIKTGMRVKEARIFCREVVVLTPDPPKYRDVHIKFKKIFSDYSDSVTPKSIDEAIIDFSGMERLNLDLVKIAHEIKKRMKEEIGEWIICSIGISTNRFLAKLAASLHKPDGLDVITHSNLLQIYEKLTLLSLNGINTRFQARLNAYEIYTPMDFLHATCEVLEKKVFISICGRQWYERIRGYEVDDIEFKTKSIGQQYALKKPTNSQRELSPLIMKLCEKMGRRLRKKGYLAYGIHLAMVYKDGTSWHRGRLTNHQMYTTMELYKRSLLIFNQQPEVKIVTLLSVSCYDLVPSSSAQMTLFDIDPGKQRKAADAMDAINDKFGEFVITPGLMMGMNDLVLDRIAFGGVKDLQDLYAF